MAILLKRPYLKLIMLKKILKLALFSALMAILIGIGVFAYFTKDLPNPAKIENHQIIQSTKIYDRTGQTILYDIHGEEKRTVIPFEQIPEYAKGATVVIEDDNFYHHIGLDWKGILRAAWANLTRQEISQGGSTITQQYIKNAYLGGPQAERTYSRKIKEAILSLILERKYSKNEILDFYLNQVPYGSNAYGIEAASQTFFNKSAHGLDLAEAALLAALPRAPSYYSPYGSHPDKLKQRQEIILDRMVKFGYISQSEADQAKEKELKYAVQTELKAHHFVTMVKEYLEDKYSRLYTDIDKAGLKVYTALDWDLQQIAEEATAKGVENNQRFNASNAALVAIDPKTGQLLAMTGSKSYQEEQFNVATSPYRQPGSSFKPFAYAAALEKGFTPQTIVFDLETNFGSGGSTKDYIPHNYDYKWRGPISFKNALAQSINIPAVKVLYLAGIKETINLAQDMGITTLKDRDRYGLSLVLGGGEVKLIDETAAYSVFASEGVKHPLSIILRVEDAQGNILEEYQDNPIKTLKAQTARQINDMLSDNQARAPMFGEYSKLQLPGRPAAAKTGTTQDYADGWTVGYTPSLAVGVWAGNNDFNNKMAPGAAGAAVAAPIWNDFMVRAYQAKSQASDLSSSNNQDQLLRPFVLPQAVERFTPPEPVNPDKPMLNGELAYAKKVAVDSVSGKLATEFTPPDLIEHKTYSQVHSILYYLDKNDPLGEFPSDPSQDPQFLNWEAPALEWVSHQPCGTNCYNQNPPSAFDDIHTPENQPEIKIISPYQRQSIPADQVNLTIKAEAEAKLGIKQIDFFFNNKLVGADSVKPYSITFNLGEYLEISDQQTIKARAYDNALNRAQDEITIKTNY